MQKNDLVFFKKWFLEYVGQFSSSDYFTQDNIERKIEHTGRVCENILLLAKSEKIGEEGSRLADTIALFHDLGRFEQFVRYKTFVDSESVDHALLGVKILKRMGILSHLLPKEKYLILKAVEYHNRLEIPECLKSSRDLLFYSKLIRDADKLDILRILSESYKEGETGRNPAYELYLPDTEGYSETIIQDILNKRMAKIRDVRNVNDLKLLRLSLIYDLNFPTSFAILKEHKYLSTVISSLAESEEVNIIRKFIEDYLDEVEIAFPNSINKP
jgi:hypothetical protein